MDYLNKFEFSTVCAEDKPTGRKVLHLVRHKETGESCYFYTAPDLAESQVTMQYATIGEMLAALKAKMSGVVGVDALIYQLGG